MLLDITVQPMMDRLWVEKGRQIMKRHLMNAKQIKQWSARRMHNFNINLRRWAQSSPFPYGNATVPKAFYSNDYSTLRKAVQPYKQNPDAMLMHHTREASTYERIADQMQRKLDLADLHDSMDRHPNALAYREDLELNGSLKNNFALSASKIHEYLNYRPRTMQIPANTVRKDSKQFNKLDSTQASDFLYKHPEFSVAVDAFSARTVRERWQANHVSTRSLTNDAEVYDGKSLRKGDLDDGIMPGELQVRANVYTHDYSQHMKQTRKYQRGVKDGSIVPHSVKQAAYLYVASKQNHGRDFNWVLEHSPQLRRRLHVVHGDAITGHAKDHQKWYGDIDRAPISKKGILMFDKTYLEIGTRRVAERRKRNSNVKARVPSVLEEAEQITKHASQKEQSKAMKGSNKMSRLNGLSDDEIRYTSNLDSAVQDTLYDKQHHNSKGMNKDLDKLENESIDHPDGEKMDGRIQDHADWLLHDKPNTKEYKEDTTFLKSLTKQNLSAYFDASEVQKHAEDVAKNFIPKQTINPHTFANYLRQSPKVANRLNIYSGKHIKAMLNEEKHNLQVGINNHEVPKDSADKLIKAKQYKIDHTDVNKVYTGEMLDGDAKLFKPLSQAGLQQNVDALMPKDKGVHKALFMTSPEAQPDVMEKKFKIIGDMTPSVKNYYHAKHGVINATRSDIDHADDPRYDTRAKNKQFSPLQKRISDRMDLRDIKNYSGTFNKPQMPSIYLNQHPNLKTRLGLRTDMNGDIYDKSGKGKHGHEPYSVYDLSARLGVAQRDLTNQVHYDNHVAARVNPHYLQHLHFEDIKHANDPDYTMADKKNGLSDNQMNTIDKQDYHDMRMYKHSLSQGENGAYYLDSHPNLKTRLYVKTGVDKNGNKRVYGKNPKSLTDASAYTKNNLANKVGQAMKSISEQDKLTSAEISPNEPQNKHSKNMQDIIKATFNKGHSKFMKYGKYVCAQENGLKQRKHDNVPKPHFKQHKITHHFHRGPTQGPEM